MRNSLSIDDLAGCYAEVPEQLQFVEEVLVLADVQDHGREVTSLGEHQGPLGLADLLDHPCRIGAELRERADIFFKVDSGHGQTSCGTSDCTTGGGPQSPYRLSRGPGERSRRLLSWRGFGLARSRADHGVRA